MFSHSVNISLQKSKNIFFWIRVDFFFFFKASKTQSLLNCKQSQGNVARKSERERERVSADLIQVIDLHHWRGYHLLPYSQFSLNKKKVLSEDKWSRSINHFTQKRSKNKPITGFSVNGWFGAARTLRNGFNLSVSKKDGEREREQTGGGAGRRKKESKRKIEEEKGDEKNNKRTKELRPEKSSGQKVKVRISALLADSTEARGGEKKEKKILTFILNHQQNHNNSAKLHQQTAAANFSCCSAAVWKPSEARLLKSLAETEKTDLFRPDWGLYSPFEVFLPFQCQRTVTWWVTWWGCD